MQKFRPIVGGILIYVFLILLLLAVICTLWLTLGTHEVTITITVVFGITIIILIPLCFVWSLRLGTITVSDYEVIYWTMNKTNNMGQSMQKIKLDKIQSLKIISKDFVKYYDKDCKARKILFFDLGQGDYKYIIITLFTKRQAEKLVQTIQEKCETLRTTK